MLEALLEAVSEVSDAAQDQDAFESPETSDFERYDDNGHEYRDESGGHIPNNTYERDGSVYETDDLGNIYCVDGKYFPDDVFVLDDTVFETDENGEIITQDASEVPVETKQDQGESTEPFEQEKSEWDLQMPDPTQHVDTPQDGTDTADSGSEADAAEAQDAAKGTPIEGHGGTWSGERGNSTWHPDSQYTPPEKSRNPEKPYSNPDNLTWAELMDKYGIEGIEFKDGYPVFDEVARGTVEIDDFTDDRDSNFAQANEKMAEQRGCTPEEVEKWMEDNNYTWHECQDCKTMQKVPNEIHANVPHEGGVSVYKSERNN